MCKRILSLVAALVLAGAVAGCGGGDDDASDEADETSETTVAPDEGTGDAAADEGAEPADDPMAELAEGFTGEGSDQFCSEMTAVEESGAADAGVGDPEFVASMKAMTPPAEIAEQWGVLTDVLERQAGGESVFETMSPEESTAWGEANNEVAAYVATFCQE